MICQTMTSTSLGFLVSLSLQWACRRAVSDRHGRGRIITHIVAALQAKQPRAFILENVRGLVTSHQPTFYRILQKLRSPWRQCL